ncbi:unnamed protein product [Rotaria sordida]|uniref:Uncharacterized protein n=1 Tax=Rotaria sordida TaxID=392033 RepID=A0A813WBF2_9BILA|nr:unnamed protein product [Rotaria sordida]CAF1266291.1 unnamed protein product [Rotaria sordida]
MDKITNTLKVGADKVTSGLKFGAEKVTDGFKAGTDKVKELVPGQTTKEHHEEVKDSSQNTGTIAGAALAPETDKPQENKPTTEKVTDNLKFGAEKVFGVVKMGAEKLTDGIKFGAEKVGDGFKTGTDKVKELVPGQTTKEHHEEAKGSIQNTGATAHTGIDVASKYRCDIA